MDLELAPGAPVFKDGWEGLAEILWLTMWFWLPLLLLLIVGIWLIVRSVRKRK